MKISRQNWYLLIYDWCRKNKRYGLTIPFLIGATKLSSIENLLNEINDTETPEQILFCYCDDLSEYILGLNDINSCECYNNLYYDKSINNIEILSKLIYLLNDQYSEIIDKGLFSKNLSTGVWEPYTKNDIDFIRRTLEKI
ncbi:hypothetical protein LJC30_06780 [Odoribacter sp. OttesenSCG-928-L07]|nr:hypothetical protein [Odoribacter sp. OttesenSCG-928-L07]